MRLQHTTQTHNTTITQRAKLKFFLILSISLLSFWSANAQVTIGSGEKPNAGAVLDLKQVAGVENGGRDSYGGLALPRVNLTKKKELFPMFLTSPDDPTSGANSEYSTKKTVLDKSHIGLIVYNLQENEDEDLCLGLNQWDGEQWNCFETKMGNAQFDLLTCDNIHIFGGYVEGRALDASHYIAINLNVTKPGAYSIKIETGNGYSFYGTGVFLDKGPASVVLQGQGQPQYAQVDLLNFEGIALATGCTPSITVSSSLAEFSLSCSDIVVSGRYKKNESLTGDNKIIVRVTVKKEGGYKIHVPLTNGISFEASGEFTASQTGSQHVTLYGQGIPTIVEDFKVNILTSSQDGNVKCEATIPITLPSMTYAIIGTGTWSWEDPARITALTNGGASFGPDGLIRIEKFSELWRTTNQSTAAQYLNNGYGVGNKKPDVILYFAYGAAPNIAITNALVNYMNQGGCVIYGAADDTENDINIMLKGIFGDDFANAAIGQKSSGTLVSVSDDDIYPITNNPSDPIINGPFGNLAGKYWGEDNATVGSVIITKLPVNSVQICSAKSDTKDQLVAHPDYSIVWYNESKNFVFFGDCVGASLTWEGNDGWPTLFSSTGMPRSKVYGPSNNGGIYRKFIYNSALELNAVAWAVKKAAVSGINPY